MRVFSGVTFDNGGKKHQFISDDRDCIPPDVKSFTEYESDPEIVTLKNPGFLMAINETEVNGTAITFQVGEEFYETAE